MFFSCALGNYVETMEVCRMIVIVEQTLWIICLATSLWWFDLRSDCIKEKVNNKNVFVCFFSSKSNKKFRPVVLNVQKKKHSRCYSRLLNARNKDYFIKRNRNFTNIGYNFKSYISARSIEQIAFIWTKYMIIASYEQHVLCRIKTKKKLLLFDWKCVNALIELIVELNSRFICGWKKTEETDRYNTYWRLAIIKQQPTMAPVTCLKQQLYHTTLLLQCPRENIFGNIFVYPRINEGKW